MALGFYNACMQIFVKYIHLYTGDMATLALIKPTLLGDLSKLVFILLIPDVFQKFVLVRVGLYSYRLTFDLSEV